MNMHQRLINQAFENPKFLIDQDSLGYFVRDIINMNWWNTCGVLLGYRKNKRVIADLTETQKRIAVQIKEFYRVRRIALKDELKFRHEIRGYVSGQVTMLEQLNAYSMRARANPSQYFHRKDGTMTWVDCTSRATYAAKYVMQNGFIDYDGKCRLLGANKILEYIKLGLCEDLGISEYFVEGNSSVKKEIFSQKENQYTIREWIDLLRIKVIPDRSWLLEAVGHVRTDAFKKYESSVVKKGEAIGVNECLYGFKTSNTIQLQVPYRASSVSVASRASRACNASLVCNASGASDTTCVSTGYPSRASGVSTRSRASNGSRESRASRPSNLISASDASRASGASDASNVSVATDAGMTTFNGDAWAESDKAIKKPDHLDYPKEFRSNIFAIAGNWKIDKEVTKLAKIGWIDPFSGHGTTPLYCKRNKIAYLGFDTNKKAFDEYLNIINEELASAPGPKVEVRHHDSTVFVPELVEKFDLCYTSPPYFNFEEYGGNTSHYLNCNSYQDYHDKITIPVFKNVYQYLVPGGVLALQTEKNKQRKELWKLNILKCGFKIIDEFVTGQEKNKYSTMSKRDQFLLLFVK